MSVGLPAQASWPKGTPNLVKVGLCLGARAYHPPAGDLKRSWKCVWVCKRPAPSLDGSPASSVSTSSSRHREGLGAHLWVWTLHVAHQAPLWQVPPTLASSPGLGLQGPPAAKSAGQTGGQAANSLGPTPCLLPASPARCS